MGFPFQYITDVNDPHSTLGHKTLPLTPNTSHSIALAAISDTYLSDGVTTPTGWHSFGYGGVTAIDWPSTSPISFNTTAGGGFDTWASIGLLFAAGTTLVMRGYGYFNSPTWSWAGPQTAHPSEPANIVDHSTIIVFVKSTVKYGGTPSLTAVTDSDGNHYYGPITQKAYGGGTWAEASISVFVAMDCPANPSLVIYASTDQGSATMYDGWPAIGYQIYLGMVPNVTIDVDPDNAAIRLGQTQQFTATVVSSGDHSVTWSSDDGTIDGTGLYTPVASGTHHVTATSFLNPLVSDTVSVIILDPTVDVDPDDASISLNSTQQYMATVTGEMVVLGAPPPPSVIWPVPTVEEIPLPILQCDKMPYPRPYDGDYTSHPGIYFTVYYNDIHDRSGPDLQLYAAIGGDPKNYIPVHDGDGHGTFLATKTAYVLLSVGSNMNSPAPNIPLPTQYQGYFLVYAMGKVKPYQDTQDTHNFFVIQMSSAMANSKYGISPYPGGFAGCAAFKGAVYQYVSNYPSGGGVVTLENIPHDVDWSTDDGSISSLGLYQPASVGTHHVTATLVFDPTVSDTVPVIVTQPIVATLRGIGGYDY